MLLCPPSVDAAQDLYLNSDVLFYRFIPFFSDGENKEDKEDFGDKTVVSIRSLQMSGYFVDGDLWNRAP